MPIVEIPVAEHKIAARRAAIETWLSKKKCDPLKFETQSGQVGIVRVVIEFQSASLAEAFRRTFDTSARKPAVWRKSVPTGAG